MEIQLVHGFSLVVNGVLRNVGREWLNDKFKP
jgi:hypothetical protein